MLFTINFDENPKVAFILLYWILFPPFIFWSCDYFPSGFSFPSVCWGRCSSESLSTPERLLLSTVKTRYSWLSLLAQRSSHGVVWSLGVQSQATWSILASRHRRRCWQFLKTFVRRRIHICPHGRSIFWYWCFIFKPQVCGFFSKIWKTNWSVLVGNIKQGCEARVWCAPGTNFLPCHWSVGKFCLASF